MNSRIKFFLSAVLMPLVFFSCKADPKTSGSAVQEITKVMYAGETDDVTINEQGVKFDSADAVTNRSNIVRSHLDYENLVNLNLHLTALKKGEEDVNVALYDANKLKKTVKVKVVVVSQTPTDEIGGSGSNPDPNNPSDPNTPPTPPGPLGPVDDPNACIKNTLFNSVSDSWVDPEGKYGEDYAARIQSKIITNTNSNITLYYPALTYEKIPPPTVSLGTYKANTSTTVEISFQLDLATKMFGQSSPRNHFYIEWNSQCFRGNIPSAIYSPPDKTLTWVTRRK